MVSTLEVSHLERPSMFFITEQPTKRSDIFSILDVLKEFKSAVCKDEHPANMFSILAEDSNDTLEPSFDFTDFKLVNP